MLYFTLDESNSTVSEAVQNGLLNVYWIGLAILQASQARNNGFGPVFIQMQNFT